jgi:hypothetical protein
MKFIPSALTFRARLRGGNPCAALPDGNVIKVMAAIVIALKNAGVLNRAPIAVLE